MHVGQEALLMCLSNPMTKQIGAEGSVLKMSDYFPLDLHSSIVMSKRSINFPFSFSSK